jgi:hypothetical protein
VGFSAVPDEVDIHIIDRPGMPFLGTGEAAQRPTAAAIANTVANAAGVRLREIPLTAARVNRAALLTLLRKALIDVTVRAAHQVVRRRHRTFMP